MEDHNDDQIGKTSLCWQSVPNDFGYLFVSGFCAETSPSDQRSVDGSNPARPRGFTVTRGD